MYPLLWLDPGAAGCGIGVEKSPRSTARDGKNSWARIPIPPQKKFQNPPYPVTSHHQPHCNKPRLMPSRTASGPRPSVKTGVSAKMTNVIVIASIYFAIPLGSIWISGRQLTWQGWLLFMALWPIVLLFMGPEELP